MQNAKQQALMFLLGAFVSGGALGAAVNRTMTRGPSERPKSAAAERKAMRDEVAGQLQLNAAQRAMLDSVLDDRNRQQRELMRPLDAQMEAIRDSARRVIMSRLTDDQRERFLRLTAEIDARRRADSASVK
jgi:CBS domain containing-hemolysin-like protein